jgi:predicted DNA binding CopG/RHH family protein
MNQEPKIGAYLDDEERELVEAIEADDYEFGENQLTEERRAELQQIARNTLNEQRQKISIRVPRTDLARLKAKAMREGVPYQTVINSLIHKHVSQ